MKLANLFKDKMKRQDNCHNGVGHINFFRPFDSKTNCKKIDFIDLVTIPPGSTIGNHFHGDNEEWYIILQGKGLMRINSKDIEVKAGDIIINEHFGEHGLVNNSNDGIFLLVFQMNNHLDKQ